MTHHLSLSAVVVALTLVLCGCESPSDVVGPPQEQTVPLVPLELGNRWTYRVTTMTTEGDTSWVDTISFFISRDTVVNGVPWSIYSYDGPEAGTVGYRNDAIGFHLTNWEHWQDSFVYPAKVGDTYGQFTVVSVDSGIVTPLGLLTCYVYRTTWAGIELYTIIAPGVGIVRRESAGIPWDTGIPFRSQDLDLIAASLVKGAG